MRWMDTGQLRQTFLEYFNARKHTIVPSSSLVPGNDSTLLFTNAGMVPFKELFLGLEKRNYTRAASSQRCVRAGGKHNDLENVGYTVRHHTFFEMLGNFSFGDYFKHQAIQYAWEFLTEILKLPPERLWVTVFEEDKEAEDIWINEIKVDPKRFSRCGAKDNFWSMGDTGPCGPCTEIFYDHGPEIAGGPPGTPEEDGDRYIEIWNLVFMQFNRLEDGKLIPLPKPSVDTGMGFERLAAVMQGVHSNYEIDIFKHLIQAIIDLGQIKDTENQSLRVVADHIRSCTFLVMDGIVPSNEGRGYVLRRIARRAIRHGHRLGFSEPFFYKLVKPLVVEMGQAYPELQEKQVEIESILHQEELQFARTLAQGLKILEQDIAELSGTLIPGDTVFKLYDTYGFPVDLTADIARERNLTLDMIGFNEAMEEQKRRARLASHFSINYNDQIKLAHITEFVGYLRLTEKSIILAMLQNGHSVSELKAGETGVIVLDHTPFYAEAGGQVGDQGFFQSKNAFFEVQSTRKTGDTYFHEGVVKEGIFKNGDEVSAEVDSQKRRATALNHSATHLLHAVLRLVLGAHVQQKGSLVEPARLRFDFSHFEALTADQIHQVEKLVNEKIWENSMVETKVLPVEQALSSGAVALFGEKYGKEVRVLEMGSGFSVELCGGTHVQRTGDIGIFKISAEYGIAAGIRRLEAVTGAGALAWIEALEENRRRVAALLKCTPDLVLEKVQQLTSRSRQLEKDIQQLKNTLAGGKGMDIMDKMQEINGIKVLAAKLPVGDIKTLRDTVDRLKHQLGSAVIVLGLVDEQGKISLIAGVTRDLTDKILATDLVNFVAEQVDGQGGGRADMAQAGGNKPENMEKALTSVYGWVSEKVDSLDGHESPSVKEQLRPSK